MIRTSPSVCLALVCGLVASTAAAEELTFRLFAGLTTEQLSVDGPRVSARFVSPRGVAADAQGNIWVTDQMTIRRIGSNGQVGTVAGLAGRQGYVDGVGGSARFFQPNAIAIDPSGEAWVVDGSAIRRVSPSGRVVTVAGGPSVGNADGTGPDALFRGPYGIAIDASGNAWVADTFNFTIRRVSPGGQVATVAGSGQSGSGDGTGPGAQFELPWGIALDAQGNAWVADSHAIRVVTPSGVVTTLPLSGFVEPFQTFRSSIDGIAMDEAGSFVVTDSNSAIFRISPSGFVTLLAGAIGALPAAADGPPASARFRYPFGVSRGPSGSILVADVGNGAIRRLGEGVVTTFAGGPVPAPGLPPAEAFAAPEAVALDSQANVWVADTARYRIRRVTPDGAVSTVVDAGSVPIGAIGGIAVDGADNVWFTDRFLHVIRRRSPSGEITTVAGSHGQFGSSDGTGAAARFGAPHQIAIDAAGNAWVTDTDNSTIRRITPTGEVTTVAGVAGMSGTVDGQGSAARFSFPTGIAIDETGLIWLLDDLSVRTMTPEGLVTTIASAVVAGVFPGQTIAARGGSAWVLNPTSQVFRITSKGDVTFVAGAGAAGGYALHGSGTGLFAGFSNANAITVDAAGTLYVADNSGLFRSVPTLADRATVSRSIGLVGQPFVLTDSPYQATTSQWSMSTTQWSMSRLPAGSSAAPLAPSSPMTSVIPDLADFYEVRLTASGPAGESISAVSFQAVSRGDLNADGVRDLFDVVTLAASLVGNAAPGVQPFLSPREAADVNGDSAYDVLDLVLLQAILVGNATAAP